MAVGVAEGVRENTGRERRHQRVAECNRHAEPDQREHVQVPGAYRLQATHEERPAAPEHDRGREYQLQQLRPAPWHDVRERRAGNHLAHCIDEQRQRQHGTDPESPPHVVEFGGVFVADDDALGLQRHAADRTPGIADVANLGVHGAGVHHALVARRHEIVLSCGDGLVGCCRMAAAVTMRVLVPGLRGRFGRGRMTAVMTVRVFMFAFVLHTFVASRRLANYKDRYTCRALANR